MRSRFSRIARPLGLVPALLGMLAAGPAWPQGTPPTGTPGPVQGGSPPTGGTQSTPSAQTPPTPTSPAPAAPAPLSQAPASPSPAAPSPAPSQPAPGATATLPTLVPDTGDTGNVDEVVLPAKPVAIVSGQSSWEEGLKSVRGSLQHIRDELAKAGIAVAGRPLTVFLQTTDENFKYDAMVPIERAPEGTTTLPGDIRFGTTPSGKAYRFVHKGPYDEIDATYETITAYLDAKDIAAKDAFIEEYVNDVADPTNPDLEINIFVQPK